MEQELTPTEQHPSICYLWTLSLCNCNCFWMALKFVAVGSWGWRREVSADAKCLVLGELKLRMPFTGPQRAWSPSPAAGCPAGSTHPSCNHLLLTKAVCFCRIVKPRRHQPLVRLVLTSRRVLFLPSIRVWCLQIENIFKKLLGHKSKRTSLAVVVQCSWICTCLGALHAVRGCVWTLVQVVAD